jgi:hypothetical protein
MCDYRTVILISHNFPLADAACQSGRKAMPAAT